MPNRQNAGEWLTIAKHDLTAAGVLFENDHFTDTIGYMLQQALEKMLKSVAAYHNQRIKKTQTLNFTNELFVKICNVLEIEQTKL